MGKVREKIYLSGFGLVGAVVVSGWSFVVYQRENLLDCAVLPFFSFEHRQKPSAMFELAHTDMHACIQPAKEATRRSMHVLVKHVPLNFSSLGLRVMARTRRLREQLDALAAAVGKAQAQAAKADERAAKADERAARMETEVALLKTLSIHVCKHSRLILAMLRSGSDQTRNKRYMTSMGIGVLSAAGKSKEGFA